MPPAARAVCASLIGRFPTARTETPASASSMAARSPDPPVPTMRTEVASWCSRGGIAAAPQGGLVLVRFDRTATRSVTRPIKFIPGALPSGVPRPQFRSTMSATPLPNLVGRHDERTALDEVISRLRGGESTVCVIRGEAGIGKSVLLEYVAAQASGVMVARAQGVEADMELAWASLHQLCTPM